MVIEIIPNWHPIFVHYTIALLSLSSLLYLAGLLFKKDVLLTVGRWNLWLGVLITVGTVVAGLQAAGSVAHSAESHDVMISHRNWALGTASFFVILALWSFIRQRHGAKPSFIFVGLLLLSTSALAVTGYKGGDLVYRYGTGVMSLPDTGSHDHSAHNHANHSHQEAEVMTEPVPPPNDNHLKQEENDHDHSTHEH